MLISVIIPVYNAEKYLSECIESVLAQTMTDFELLLIDDGSRDSSGALCDRYASQDSRIRVFHQANGGASHARNFGLDNARGTFVTFVDSDDWITPQHLQQFVDSGIGEGGIAFSNISEEHKSSAGSQGRVTTLPMPDLRIEGGRDACMPAIAQLLRGRCFGWTCNKLLSLKTIRDHALRFDERLRYAEDELFTAQYCTHITHLVSNSCPTYFYRYVAGSLLHGYKDPLSLMQTRRQIFNTYKDGGYSDEVLYLSARTQFSRLRRELRRSPGQSPLTEQLTQGLLESYRACRLYAHPAYCSSFYDRKVRLIGYLACAAGSPRWAQFVIKGLHL